MAVPVLRELHILWVLLPQLYILYRMPQLSGWECSVS